MKVFGVVGWRGEEKTELILNLVTYLSRHNIRVSVIRHWTQGGQETADADDNYSFRRCGSVETLVAAPDQWTLLQEVPHETEFDLSAAIDSLSEVDLVLVDGFKSAEHPKLLVVHPQAKHQLENTQLLLAACPNVVALAMPSGCVLDLSEPQFEITDVAEIGHFIIQQCDLGGLAAGED